MLFWANRAYYDVDTKATRGGDDVSYKADSGGYRFHGDSGVFSASPDGVLLRIGTNRLSHSSEFEYTDGHAIEFNSVSDPYSDS